MLNKSSLFSLSILTVALMVGCGGGGTGDVVVPVKNLPLAVTAASSISIQSGTSATYKINGGGNGATFVNYSATSSNNAAATVSVSGNILTVTGKGGGTGKIAVNDSASNSVTFDFIVSAASSPLPFKVNAPSQSRYAINATATYEIIGGVLPYVAASSNQGVVKAIVNGSQLSVTGLSSGTANIVVFDGIGTPITLTTLVGDGDTVPTPVYSTAPAALTIKPNLVTTYLVGGGTAPYFAASSNPSLLTAKVIDKTLELSTLSVGLSDVIVTDSKGATFKIAVDIAETSKPFFTTAPATVILTPNATANYVVSGGTPPYTVSSGNVGAVNASVVGESLRIVASASGSSNLVVFDSNAKSQQIVVVVNSGITPFYTTAPSAITLKAPEIGTYQISGGKSPYVAVSGNTSVATASVNGSELQIASKAVGTASVVVRDSSGAVVTISVTTN